MRGLETPSRLSSLSSGSSAWRTLCELRSMNQSTTLSKLLRANVDVRLISGDHLETAKHWALQAGIITREEYKDDEVCFNGNELFDIIGETPVNVDGRRWQYSEERAKIVKKV